MDHVDLRARLAALDDRAGVGAERPPLWSVLLVGGALLAIAMATAIAGRADVLLLLPIIVAIHFGMRWLVRRR